MRGEPTRHCGGRYALKHESNCFALKHCMCLDVCSNGYQWPGINWLTDWLMGLHLRIESVNLYFLSNQHIIYA